MMVFRIISTKKKTSMMMFTPNLKGTQQNHAKSQENTRVEQCAYTPLKPSSTVKNAAIRGTNTAFTMPRNMPVFQGETTPQNTSHPHSSQHTHIKPQNNKCAHSHKTTG